MSLRKCKLGDVVTLSRGFDLTEQQRTPGSVPVITSSGITGYHGVAKVNGPGVVTGRYGTLGAVYYIEGDYWPHNTALYVKDFKGNNPRFVSYMLKNVGLALFNGAGAVPGVNRNVLHEIDVFVPSINVQCKIADILSAYDDLIENNRRRMALLEEAARMIYREWFVHLRFPGYEKTRIVDGVPEGWERLVFASLCHEVRDAVSPNKVSADTAYIGLEHMPRRSITLDTWGYAKDISSTKHRYMAGDILFGKIRPYFHKVGLTLTDGVASSDAIVIRTFAERYHYFVLLLASSDEFVAVAAQTMREGSKMPRADWKIMQAHSVLSPPQSLLNEFNAIVVPIVNQLRSLAFQNQKLSQARDILLPRLMSGEIDVSEAAGIVENEQAAVQ